MTASGTQTNRAEGANIPRSTRISRLPHRPSPSDGQFPLIALSVNDPSLAFGRRYRLASIARRSARPSGSRTVRLWNQQPRRIPVGIAEWRKQWRERREQKRARQVQERAEMIERIRRGEPPKTESEAALRILFSRATASRVVTCPQGVVTYRVARSKTDIGDNILDKALQMTFKPEATDNKIKEILAVNPRADLRKMASALGIEIIDCQLTSGGPGHDSGDVEFEP